MYKIAFILLIVLLNFMTSEVTAQVHKKLSIVQLKVSSQREGALPDMMIDGRVADDSRWLSEVEKTSWVELTLDKERKVGGLHIYSGYMNGAAIADFKILYLKNNQWEEIPSALITDNSQTGIAVEFDDTKQVVTKALKIFITKSHENIARIKEIVVWPYTCMKMPPLGTGVKGFEVTKMEDDIPKIYLNQSGFNIGAPKRFTAPTIVDNSLFVITKKESDEVLFQGIVRNNIGDFSLFNPIDGVVQYVVRVGGEVSFPFSIGYWWLERVTYQNMIDFMVDSRHYVGNYKKKCWGSYGWRDDHQFGWELHALVSQYLSNPEAYDRMPKQVKYDQPKDSTL